MKIKISEKHKRISKIIFLFVITAVFSQIFAGVVYAYNPYGISDGLYMKLEEEKSALEYRINQLETSSQNNPGLSVLTIQSRIDALIIERDGKKNYITGIYAHNGAIEMLPSALAEIDSQYKSQIDNLEQQKSLYNQQYANEQDVASAREETQKLKMELSDLQAQMEEQKRLLLMKEYDDTSKALDESIQSMVDKFNTETNSKVRPPASDVFANLDVMEDQFEAARLFVLIKTDSITLYNQIQALAKAKYFNNKSTPAEVFGYMDSLSNDEMQVVYTKLGIFNPELRTQVNELVRIKYPDGKFNTTVKKPNITDIPPTTTKKPLVREDLKLTSTLESKIATTTDIKISTSSDVLAKPQEKKISLFRRILNWLGLWKK